MSEDNSLKQTVTPNYSASQDYVKTNSMEQYLPVLAVSHLSEYRQYRQNVEPGCFDESLHMSFVHKHRCWKTVYVSDYTYNI